MMKPLFLILIFGLGFFWISYLLLIPALTQISVLPAQVYQAPHVQNLANERKRITLMFVGDIMLDRGVEYMVEKYGQGDYRFPFLEIKPHLEEADILFGNLESVISDKGQKIGSAYSFRANPQSLEGLIYAGFDIVSVANNHVLDYGREAMEDSFSRLEQAGIDYVGGGMNKAEAEAPLIKKVGQTRIAFLAYTNLCSVYWQSDTDSSGINCLTELPENSSESQMNLEIVREEIKKAKNQADLVIVSFHYGDEYKLEPNYFQVSISQMAVAAGADLVIGHHAHVIQPVEKYEESYIAYSLGNFIFDQGFSEETKKGFLLKVAVENNKIAQVIPLTFKMNEYFQPQIQLSK